MPLYPEITQLTPKSMITNEVTKDTHNLCLFFDMRGVGTVLEQDLVGFATVGVVLLKEMAHLALHGLGRIDFSARPAGNGAELSQIAHFKEGGI